jgi:hypothetical protein
MTLTIKFFPIRFGQIALLEDNNILIRFALIMRIRFQLSSRT